jgi:predicted DNA-binding ribbon-helix-helix protein
VTFRNGEIARYLHIVTSATVFRNPRAQRDFRRALSLHTWIPHHREQDSGSEPLFRYHFEVRILVESVTSWSIVVPQKGINSGTFGMKSLVVKRSVAIAGHKTSVSLEDAFWKSLKEIATSGNMTLSGLLAAIDSGRHHGNLSSAIRLFVLSFYRERLDIQNRHKAIEAALHSSIRELH